MDQKITTFPMFDGRAEKVMNFCISLFADSRIVDVKRYGPEGPGTEGSVMHAAVELAGQRFMCIDSVAKHPFAFTSVISALRQLHVGNRDRDPGGEAGRWRCDHDAARCLPVQPPLPRSPTASA